MRSNPRILSYHVSMAAHYWRQQFESGGQNAEDIQQQFEDMLRGMQLYLSHDYERNNAHLERVYKDGSLTILSFGAHDYQSDKPALLLVPSLINKAHIFDLTEKRSMLRYFCDQGIDAYLLDWGEFLHDPDMQNLDNVVCKKLFKAAAFLQGEYSQNLHALGYCMGGSLLAGFAAIQSDVFRSLSFMAAPWDFHAGTQEILDRVKFWQPSLGKSLIQEDMMKVDWLQILFSSLNPEQALHKFSKFADYKEGSDAQEIFVAIEDWLNDGVPLPAGVAQEAVQDWFLSNNPCQGKWVLDGEAVELSSIDIPSLVIASSKDRLVEYDMAVPLHAQIKDAELIDPECGHIGMIAGRDAVESVWRHIADWVLKNQ